MNSEWPLVAIEDIAGDWKGSMAVGPAGRADSPEAGGLGYEF